MLFNRKNISVSWLFWSVRGHFETNTRLRKCVLKCMHKRYLFSWGSVRRHQYLTVSSYLLSISCRLYVCFALFELVPMKMLVIISLLAVMAEGCTLYQSSKMFQYFNGVSHFLHFYSHSFIEFSWLFNFSNFVCKIFFLSFHVSKTKNQLHVC